MTSHTPLPGETPYSRNELREGLKLHPTAAKILLDQGTLAVQDLLDAKKQFEAKAFALLAGNVAFAGALLGVVMRSEPTEVAKVILFLAGVSFALAAIAAAVALFDVRYGAAGVDPRGWLTSRALTDVPEDVVTGDEHKAARLCALLAHDLGKHVEACQKANSQKAMQLSAALTFTLVGIVVAIFLGGGAQVFLKA